MNRAVLLRSRHLFDSLLVFPLAALLNSFSMTGLLLLYGLAGHVETAADIGLAQAATLAIFFTFSANARNVVLGDKDLASAQRLLSMRLVLMLPVAAAAWTLSVHLGDAAPLLAAVLVARRLAEWLGEIGLAVHEVKSQPSFARQFLLVEVLTVLLACLPLVTELPLAVCLLPWALAPLVPIRQLSIGSFEMRRIHLQFLLPHFGSTAAIGISTYVFRISISLLAGKAPAGELFTAFAIGNLIPTVFGQAFAPSLAMKYRDRSLPRQLLILPVVLVVTAATLAVVIQLNPGWFRTSLHTPSFWSATAFSIAGGALMSMALIVRTRLIQSMRSAQVFGPDLLANMLIATCVPFVSTMFGTWALGALFLLSSALNLIFFVGARRGMATQTKGLRIVLCVIAVTVVAPVFVQVCCRLFDDPTMLFQVGGDLMRLPLPLSIVAVFAGIAALGNYAYAIRTLTTLFFTAVLFVLTSLIVVGGDKIDQGSKLVLLAQFLLPLFGLVLGEMFAAASPHSRIFERAGLCMLLAVLPAQLVATWSQGALVAHPQVYFFSIYQHLQYFPSIVAAIATMATLALWGSGFGWRVALSVLWPIVMVHLVASNSANGVLAGLSGLLMFALWHGRQKGQRLQVIGIVLLSLALALGYAFQFKPHWPADRELTSTQATHEAPGRDLQAKERPNSLASGSIIHSWREYASASTSSFKALMLGHAERLDRQRFPSAYNYWLDAVYNFGFISVLPLLALLAATARAVWQRKRELASDPGLAGSVFVLAWLLLAENMVNVGLRQPYPGLLTCFLWGRLFGRLQIEASLPHAEDKPLLP